jgi:putative membrane protein
MTVIALIFAGVAALLHVFFWTLESLTWRRPSTWRRFGLASQDEADTTASLAYNQGFYNLFLAAGAIAGIAVVAVSDSHDSIGWTLIAFACACMLGASLVLISTGRAFAQAALVQGGPALVAIVTGLVAAR